MSPEQVLEALRDLKGANPSLEKTLMSLGVNYCGDDVFDIATRAHTLFAHDNNVWVEACPGSLEIEQGVLAFAAGLLSGGEPGVVATMTSGGTESIFNAVHAARERAVRLHPDITDPTWICSFNAHPAITKACHYLGIELVRLPDKDCRADVQAFAAALDERTIGLYGSTPCFPFGIYDDIPALGRLALEHDLWLHCDACVGGFLAPFFARLGEAVPPWDFSVPGVTSISADIHKFAYGLKPASVTAWRDASLLEYHLSGVVVNDWPLGHYESAGFVGSRPTGSVAAAWAVIHLLGEQGYLDRAREILRARSALLAGLATIDGITFPTPLPELQIVTYAGDDRAGVDRILRGMEERGWIHFANAEPPLLLFVVDPGAGAILHDYLADLAGVVERARAGAFASDKAAKAY
jgi:glutamate/tyrosine decarboxylase-like PLP-dependent enzyme